MAASPDSAWGSEGLDFLGPDFLVPSGFGDRDKTL